MWNTQNNKTERQKVCLNQPKHTYTHTHTEKEKGGRVTPIKQCHFITETDNDLDLDSAGAAHPEQLSGTHGRPAVRSQPSDGRLSRPGAAVCMGCMEFEPLSKTVKKVTICSY